MNLTLVICLYNAEKYISETLYCIANQTLQEFNLLIINDCSTDNSMQIVDNFFKQHPRQYKVINFEENKGLAYGRHYVEKTVITPYILFIDADDCPYPTLVEKMYTKIKSDPDLIAVGCYHEFIDSKSKKIGGGIFIGEKSKEDFHQKASRQKLIFMQPTAIIDREALLSVGGRNIDGFPPGKPRYQDLCEDLDLWTRMSDLYINGKAIVVLPEILCRYRKHEQALSSNSLGMVLRMRHIKTNLLRRRSGEKDLTFIEFYDSLSEKKLSRLKRDSEVADSLRNGVFYAKKGNIIKGGCLLLKSIVMNPKYFWQKLKSNSGIWKKK